MTLLNIVVFVTAAAGDQPTICSARPILTNGETNRYQLVIGEQEGAALLKKVLPHVPRPSALKEYSADQLAKIQVCHALAEVRRFHGRVIVLAADWTQWQGGEVIEGKAVLALLDTLGPHTRLLAQSESLPALGSHWYGTPTFKLDLANYGSIDGNPLLGVRTSSKLSSHSGGDELLLFRQEAAKLLSVATFDVGGGSFNEKWSVSWTTTIALIPQPRGPSFLELRTTKRDSSFEDDAHEEDSVTVTVWAYDADTGRFEKKK